MMKQIRQKSWQGLFLLLLLSLPLGLFGCGGGSSSVAVSTGKVTVLVTDGPAADFDEINVRLERVELLGNGGPITVFSRQPGKLVDLLRLRGESQVLTLSDEVPAGSYAKIRLQVSSVELVKRAADGSILERHLADLPANGKIDLNPRGTFEVSAGATLLIQLDLDANKAIHLVQAGQSQRYKFRPVIFVTIGELMPQGKLVRLDGSVRALTADGFLLCKQPTPTATDDWSGRCVEVRVLPETVIYDELGDPVSLAALQLNDPVQVIGRFAPPPALADAQTRDSFDAYVVEIGQFLTLRGRILNPPLLLQGGAVSFNLEPAPGQGVTGVVQVQAEGTRVFSADGGELGLADLAAGDTVLVDGVLALGSTADTFKAALIIRETPLTETAVEGRLIGPDPLDNPLLVETQGGNRCVRTTLDTSYYLLTAGSLAPISFGQLALNDDVLAFGREDATGCLVADDLFVRQ